jgi:hypothetical protein
VRDLLSPARSRAISRVASLTLDAPRSTHRDDALLSVVVLQPPPEATMDQGRRCAMDLLTGRASSAHLIAGRELSANWITCT